ncbi:DUF2804 domain-containing protein [Hoyosella sp. G463]|uniref:DUF2804 domain-containing protein n=1 Tax=Lolliginicoccus lacisalsi TaxID=2742202 RepID=A0A927JAJ0_9ACTN|nr:DUF2804 domain-containing protein [Lolliginicoccus lacisalsi]MBD8505689.1 DUF2804 domain-containing protein [Lolliginicoccus lacisalsi]
MDLPPAPARLPRPGERAGALDGCYLGPIADLSTREWDHGLPFRRRAQRKAWVYAGIFAEQASAGIAIVDAGHTATAFCYVHDRRTGRLTEDKILVPAGFPRSFAPDWRAEWTLGRGRGTWRIHHEGGAWHVHHRGRDLELSAILGGPDGHAGLSAISSAPGRPFHHTYKVAGLPASGTASARGSVIPLEGRASVDFTLGYPPRETLWNWASLDGTTESGQPIAINLVAHFLNGLENAAWWQDGIVPLPQATFELDRSAPLDPWRLRTAGGELDLVFHPEGQRREHLEAGVIASKFVQPFGWFEGTFRSPGGEVHELRGRGVVEDHRARW